MTQVVLPRANHVLFEAQTGAGNEYPRLQRFVGGYFDRMAAWLAARQTLSLRLARGSDLEIGER